MYIACIHFPPWSSSKVTYHIEFVTVNSKRIIIFLVWTIYVHRLFVFLDACQFKVKLRTYYMFIFFIKIIVLDSIH
jgi:hypothetical protein